MFVYLVSLDGNEKVCYTYDAWGNCTVTKNTDGIAELNPYRYRSYYYDSETHLYYLINRYYDPEIGRFVSQDDVTYLDPEHVNGLNLYAYCRSNPVMHIDPNGTVVEWVILIICILITAVIAGIDGGISAAINGDNFGWGFLAGFLGGLIQGLCIAVIPVVGPVVGRLLGSITYGLLNEVFQRGSLEKMDWNNFAMDLIMDTVSSMFYANLPFNILGSIISGIIDAIIDIIQTILFNDNSLVSVGYDKKKIKSFTIQNANKLKYA